MTTGEPQSQLEFFDLTTQPSPKPRPYTLGRLVVHVRHDQLVLAGIGGLIGLTVVFACGVERGKQLTRGERVLMAHQELPPQRQATEAATRPTASQAPSVAPAADTKSPTPTPAQRKREPTKLATAPPEGRSRYAVQIVSYRQAPLAQKELARLQAIGERAFLVLKGDYAVLYVGPFPSKSNAHEKVVQLKRRYAGCFVKAL